MVFEFGNEILSLTNAPAEAIDKRPITQNVNAAIYARRSIVETVFK